MIPKIYVNLVITGEDITTSLLEKFAKIGASKCWTKDQKIGDSILVRKYDGCEFSFGPIIDYYADEVAIKYLKKLIESNAELFNIILEYNLNPKLSITGYASDVIPSFYFESSYIKLLAKYNISLDIDVISISGDE